MNSCDKIIFDNKIIEKKAAFLSISNRAFRYGDSLFESLLIKNGRVVFFEEHFSRLTKGMSLLGLQPNDLFFKKNILNAIQNLAESNQHQGNARVRIQVWRSGNGFYAPESNESHILIETLYVENNEFPFSHSISVTYYPSPLLSFSILTPLKKSGAIPYIFAMNHAISNGYDDCLLLNNDNNIAEATSSNIFIIEGSKIITPPLSDGCLDGIMRMKLIQLFSEFSKPISEESITIHRFQKSDASFLTNSVRGIIPIGNYTNSNNTFKSIQNLIRNELKY